MAIAEDVQEIPRESNFHKLRNWFNKFDKFTKAFLVTMLLILMAIPIILTQKTNLFSRATSACTYGADANDTGNPIGGGKGYNNIITTGTHIVTTGAELKAHLVGGSSSAKSGEVIYLPYTPTQKTAIDFGSSSDGYNLQVPSGVTIASNRGQILSDGTVSPGALVKSSYMPTSEIAMFVPRDHVTFNGLRIEGYSGGYYETSTENSHKSANIFCQKSLSGCYRLVIENCEIYNSPRYGIRLWGQNDAVGFTNFDSPETSQITWIHHNYIHNHQLNGFGYGIDIANTVAVIEANIFDYQRHHIAGNRALNYIEARYNVFGPNGPQNSMYDNHGGSDTTAGGYGPYATCQLGVPTGAVLRVHHNTFQSSSRTSVGIRGVPATNAEFSYNWDYHSKPSSVEGEKLIYNQRLETCVGMSIDGITVTSSNKNGYIRMSVHDNWYGTTRPTSCSSSTPTPIPTSTPTPITSSPAPTLIPTKVPTSTPTPGGVTSNTLYPIGLDKFPAAGGTVISSPAGINCETSCTWDKYSFTSGTLVTLTATPATGYNTVTWSGACIGTAKTCTVTMNAYKSIKATFK
jgi:hypothetical protein